MKVKHYFVTWIGKHERLRFCLRCIRRFRDDTFVRDVNGLYVSVWDSAEDPNPRTIRLVRKGDLNKSEAIYYINLASTPFVGLLAMFVDILKQLYYADCLGMSPVVSISDKNCLYYETGGVDGTFNVWEYYFEQYRHHSIDEVDGSYLVVEQMKDVTRLFPELKHERYRLKDDAIEQLGDIMKKYVHLNRKTEKIICDGISDLIGDKKTLGVQIRMGSMLFGLKNHPVVPKLDRFVKTIDRAMQTNGFEQVFLATDDERAVERITREFPGKVVYYTDVQRVEDVVDTTLINTSRPNHQYLCGLEVLRDVYTLASCDGMLAGLSNVVTAAQITKKSLGKDWDYLQILDEGINHENGMADDCAEFIQEVAKKYN